MFPCTQYDAEEGVPPVSVVVTVLPDVEYVPVVLVPRPPSADVMGAVSVQSQFEPETEQLPVRPLSCVLSAVPMDSHAATPASKSPPPSSSPVRQPNGVSDVSVVEPANAVEYVPSELNVIVPVRLKSKTLAVAPAHAELLLPDVPHACVTLQVPTRFPAHGATEGHVPRPVDDEPACDVEPVDDVAPSGAPLLDDPP